MKIIGLTGGIGMGKSTFTNLISRSTNVSVFDSDREIHDLYRENDNVKKFIREKFPTAFDSSRGIVNRTILGDLVLGDDDKLQELNNTLLHCFDIELFFHLTNQRYIYRSKTVIIDMPLLLQSHWKKMCDYIVVVTCSEETQRKRVFARDEHMTEERFANILKRQLPNAERLAQADYVIDTDLSMGATERQIFKLIEELGLDRE